MVLQVAAGIALSLLAVFGATVWLFSRQRRSSENLDRDQSVFKVPQSPTPKTPKHIIHPITEPDVQEDAGQFEDTEETEENIDT
ncbi:hypothetical protein CRUP_034698 [Coryphaenoides rupestris]|nr:hypothetical protein CRUP_034698 [Coryphaenoides rupestris]